MCFTAAAYGFWLACFAGKQHFRNAIELRRFLGRGHLNAKAFLERASDLLAFLLPRYRSEGKTYLTIAIGCTGGKHRSVALSAALAERLEASGQPVRLWHRDLEKE